MATKHNSRRAALYPQGDQFNQRENRASTHNNTLLEGDPDESLTVASDDAVSFVKADGDTADLTVTLPNAAENKGRCLTVYAKQAAASPSGQIDISASDGANIDGSPTLSFTADNEWRDLFCDGSEWHVVRSS